MNKCERELRQRIKAVGLEIEEFGYSGTNHYKVRLRGEHGTATLTFCLTPSDKRNQVLQQVRLKQVADGRWPGLRRETQEDPR